MPDPGSVLLAAFPNQCTTRQEGNYKSISLKFWQGETKWTPIFPQKGESSMLGFFTYSISHSTRKDSTFLPWTIYLLSCIACFWQAGSDSNLSWGTKSSTASSWYHLISAVQEADRRYLILSCLLLKKMGDVPQFMVRCPQTVTTPSFRQQRLYSQSAKRWL